MKSTNKQNIKKYVKIVVIGIVAVGASVMLYRYLNRPAQIWGPDTFENRNPDKVAVKGQGQKYWQATSKGHGFYVTDVSIEPGATKTYCVSGGAGGTSDATAEFNFGGQDFSVKNGFFAKCAKVTVNDKRQISFSMVNGELQVYQVDRKR